MNDPDPPIGWALLFWFLVSLCIWVAIIAVGAYLALDPVSR